METHGSGSLSSSRPRSRRRPPGPRGCAGRGRRGASLRRSRRPPGSRAWSRRGRPRSAARRSATGQAPSSTSRALIRRSRVIDSSTPSSSAGVRRAPCGETQKIEEVGGSSTMPSGRTSTASSAPCAFGEPRRLHVGRVGERLDAVEDHRRGVGDGGEADRLAVGRDRLGHRQSPAAAGDDQPQLAVGGAELGEQRLDLGFQRGPVELELDRGGGAPEPVDVVAEREGPALRRGGSPRRRRRRGRGRRPGAGPPPRRSARSSRRRWPALSGQPPPSAARLSHVGSRSPTGKSPKGVAR